MRPSRTSPWTGSPTRAATSRSGAIAKALKGASTLHLATDPDREGEAISLACEEHAADKNALKGINVRRITFNEITRNAVRYAMAHPRDLDQPLIEAHLAAERWITWWVSRLPVLWRKLRQPQRRPRSVRRIATDLRPRSGDRGVPRPRILDGGGRLTTPGGAPFTARLTHWRARSQQFDLANEDAMRAKQRIECRSSRRLGREEARQAQPVCAVHHIDAAAGGLAQAGFWRAADHASYAAALRSVDIGGETTGLITYMRTDGVQMAREAIDAIRGHVQQVYGDKYSGRTARIPKPVSRMRRRPTRRSAPPTSPTRRTTWRALPQSRSAGCTNYRKRAVASQMQSAELTRSAST